MPVDSLTQLVSATELFPEKPLTVSVVQNLVFRAAEVIQFTPAFTVFRLVVFYGPDIGLF